MAMAKPSLAEGVRRVTALPPLNAPGTAAAGSSSAEEAWAALSQGLRQCRKSPEVLDRFSEPERLAVLKFLVLWPKTRKTLRGQATQYHQTLKTSALWAETARSEEFQRFLHVELSEDQVEVLNSPPKVVTTLPESLPRRISVPADVAETSLAHLRASLAVMERYGFLFPNEFHSTGLDQGIRWRSCQARCSPGAPVSVATAISKLDEKEHVAEAILGQLDVPWEDVLKFLISMYESGVRKVLDARLKFVVNTFRSSSRFRQATETLDLPWEADALGAEGGYSPEPAEPYVDASSEPVPSGEDEGLRKDFELAWDMQSKDIKRHLKSGKALPGSTFRRLFAL